MKFLTILLFGAALLGISLRGIANAQDAPEKMTMKGGMSMMHSDPAAMCASMMKSMMSDPVVHSRMNEMMRHHMGDMSMMHNDPMAMYSAMMQSMMKDPVMHHRMNELMRKHMGSNSMAMPMSSTSQNAAPTSH